MRAVHLIRRRAQRPRTNPFHFGDVALGEQFIDRTAELGELLGDLRSGQNMLVLAPRRFGKTSLIVATAERLRKEDVLVAYADLLRVTTKTRFAEALAAALYDGLEPPVGRLVQRAADFFRDLPLRPKVTVNPDGTPSFELAAGADERDVDATLDQLFALPGAVAKRRSRRVVVVLDEFQEIVAIAPELPARMRAVFQFQPEVAHVYLGSRQHLLRRVFTDANQPLYNSAKVMALGPIAPEVFAAFIQERYNASGKTITPEATIALLGYTNGHPHDTQKLAYFTWALVPEGADATTETVDAAVGQILETDTARYTELWDSLATNQRRLLEALAKPDRPANPLSDAFRRAHRLGSYASADRALDALFERGYVERVGRDAVAIPDVFLRLWLQEEPATSIVSLVCGTCGAGFAVPVWHCPDCDNHSHQDDIECGNCHHPRPSAS